MVLLSIVKVFSSLFKPIWYEITSQSFPFPLISYFASTSSPPPPPTPQTPQSIVSLPLHQFCSFPLFRRPYQMVFVTTSSVLGEPFVYVANIGDRSRGTCAKFNIYFKSIENIKGLSDSKKFKNLCFPD